MLDSGSNVIRMRQMKLWCKAVFQTSDNHLESFVFRQLLAEDLGIFQGQDIDIWLD
jgi:hypothetical protein